MDEQTMAKQAKFWGTFYPGLVIVYGIITLLVYGLMSVSAALGFVMWGLWIVVLALMVLYLNRTVRYSWYEYQHGKDKK